MVMSNGMVGSKPKSALDRMLHMLDSMLNSMHDNMSNSMSDGMFNCMSDGTLSSMTDRVHNRMSDDMAQACAYASLVGREGRRVATVV